SSDLNGEKSFFAPSQGDYMTRRFRYPMAVTLALAMLGICVLPALAESPNLVIQWNNAALQGVRDSKLGPPMGARALFIAHNCIYDAWAAYDRRAVGKVFGRALRRPKWDRTFADENEAISFGG